MNPVDELKPCSFCGSTDPLGNEGCICASTEALQTSRRAWNTRPVEDALLEACENFVAFEDVVDRWLSKGNLVPLWYDGLIDAIAKTRAAIAKAKP